MTNTKRNNINPLLIVIIIAFLFLAITLFTVYMLGYRYIRIDNGIRYFGKVYENQPISGKLYYPDGIKAKLIKEKDSMTGKILFSNGDIYEGNISGLLRHDQGEMYYALSKDRYIGEFYEDKKHGMGEYIYSNEDRYIGSFIEDKKNGFGEFIWSDGSYYYGNFKDNARDGTGVLKNSEGSEYIGSYKDDKRHGNEEVMVKLKNGEVYTGENKLTFSNGDIYIGDFNEDKRTGYGTYIWISGEKYTGQFEDGVLYGKGTYYWIGGRSPYEGYFENGKIVFLNTDHNETNTTTNE